MICTTTHLLDFWCTPWSQPLRRANLWLERFGQPVSGKRPNHVAPDWLRPLFLQRWVGQTIAARLAWLRQQPDSAAYRYERESRPCWHEAAWQSYPRRILRGFSEATLLDLFGIEVERLLRISQEPPVLVGEMEWTRATLGASEHIAQVYAELKRRCKATRARALLREALDHYCTWQPEHQAR